MLNDNAKAWVAALRSGQYKQGANKLNIDGRLCCLGVACEIAGVAKRENKDGVVCYDKAFSFLPESVQSWLELSTEDGTLCLHGHWRSLVSLNDSGKTFAEIADLIESEPERLFVK